MPSRKRSAELSYKIKERAEKRKLKMEKREARREAKKLRKQNSEKDFNEFLESSL